MGKVAECGGGLRAVEGVGKPMVDAGIEVWVRGTGEDGVAGQRVQGGEVGA